MKTFYLNIQSKGGSGKSMLSYLQGLKRQADKSSCFIDLDSSTKSSSTQLAFLKEDKRLLDVNIYDNSKRIDREKLIKIFEGLVKLDFESFYMDFGAPESEQLPSLLTIELGIDDFKEFEKELGIKIVFNVIMAGGTAYLPSFEYLKRIAEIVKGKFDLIVYINDNTFQNYEAMVEDVKNFAQKTKGVIKEVRHFGDIKTDRESGQLIINNIKEGKGIDGYDSFIAKRIIKREIEKV